MNTQEIMEVKQVLKKISSKDIHYRQTDRNVEYMARVIFKVLTHIEKLEKNYD